MFGRLLVRVSLKLSIIQTLLIDEGIASLQVNLVQQVRVLLKILIIAFFLNLLLLVISVIMFIYHFITLLQTEIAGTNL